MYRVAARSKALVCGRSLAGIAGSNSAVGMDIYMLRVCVLSLRRADHSSRRALPTVGVSLCAWPTNLKNEDAISRVGCERHGKKYSIFD
jgi:hypothetical protein